MPYTIEEGRIHLDCIEDRSINVLTLAPQGGGAPLNLVVNRDALRPGESLKACLDRQIRELTRVVRDFSELGREAGWLGSGNDPSYPAIVVYTRFKQDGRLCFQAQCLAQLPGDKLLVLTLTCPSALDEAMRARWKEILIRFEPSLAPGPDAEN